MFTATLAHSLEPTLDSQQFLRKLTGRFLWFGFCMISRFFDSLITWKCEFRSVISPKISHCLIADFLIYSILFFFVIFQSNIIILYSYLLYSYQICTYICYIFDGILLIWLVQASAARESNRVNSHHYSYRLCLSGDRSCSKGFTWNGSRLEDQICFNYSRYFKGLPFWKSRVLIMYNFGGFFPYQYGFSFSVSSLYWKVKFLTGIQCGRD